MLAATLPAPSIHSFIESTETIVTGASGEIGTLLGEKYPGAVLIGRRKINHKNYLAHDLTTPLKPFPKVKKLIHLSGLVEETNNIFDVKKYMNQNIFVLERDCNIVILIKLYHLLN